MSDAQSAQESVRTADTPLLSALEDWLSGWLVRRRLPSNLDQAVRYVLLGGGKRVRPLLALRCCEAVGGTAERAIPAAAAIELVHNFSLVHDDLPAIDDDCLRRGRPTLHVCSGEAMAILAGDALLGLAFEVLASERPPELAGRLCLELSRATNDMIVGQVQDTLPAFPDEVRPLERLQTIQRNKTMALIRGACRMGALCGGAKGDRLAAVSEYAEAVGLMFQIVDDVLDVTQTTDHLGKTANKDMQQGKLTYPSLMSLDACRAEVERLRGLASGALGRLAGAGAPGGAIDLLADLCERLARRTR